MAKRASTEVARAGRSLACNMSVIERKSFREIGETLGLSHVQVVKNILAAIDEINEERRVKIEILRTRENAKLDVIEAALMKQIETEILIKDGGRVEIEAVNKNLIDSLIRLTERRAKLNGLDRPVKHELTVDFRQQVEEEFAGRPWDAIEQAKKILNEASGN